MGTRFGFVSTYPPTQCGLATFTSSLHRGLTAAGMEEGWVARLVELPQPRPADEVVAQIVMDDPATTAPAIARLNECDVVILQHEFGVYGGADGEDILEILAKLTVPSIVELHTIRTEPTAHQREVLESVVRLAQAVVTMTDTARDRLANGYDVDLGKVSVIAHGAPEAAPPQTDLNPVFRTGQATILTWGLLGPGKGIEWGIRAMAHLRDLQPAPRYLIAGQTHPKVLRQQGDAYRRSLGELAQQMSVADSVSFDGRYRDSAELAELVASADVVLLPYDSTEQVTSGVLIEAVAAGKPVIATEFPHAVELL